MNYFTLPLMGMLLLCSCSNKSTGNTNAEMTVTNNVVTLNAASPILQKIKTQKITTGSYQPQFSTSGVVKAIPTAYAEITTPFAGRIVRSFVRLGENVQKGSPLFAISSPGFFETGKSYFNAKQEMEQALKNLKREKDLLANRVGIQKEVEEAEVNYHLKYQEYENARSALKVFQASPEEVKLGEPLIVRAPITGKVVQSHIVLGQYLKDDAEPLAVVADLSKVWVVAHVKEKDIRLIERLQEVDIRLSASPEEVIKGTVYHISEMLDEATRAAEVIVECDNSKGRMKPFMYGTVQLTDKPMKAILLPNTALLQEEEGSYVFVAVEKNRFRKTPVVVATAVGTQSVIASGVNAGDEIVTEGAFYLLDAK